MKINFFLFQIALFSGVLLSFQSVSAAITTDAECKNPANGGYCNTFNSCTPGVEAKIGMCDEIETAGMGEGASPTTTYVTCCKKIAPSTPGTEEYCINTMKGNCVKRSDTCGKGAQVQVCPNSGSTQRICCVNPAITGPALSTYQLLEKIPGSTFSTSTSGKLNTYLEDIYRFAFWAVGIAVVFMLTIGGFMYLTSAGNTSRLSTAKTIIFDAILGLILALVAWLFLNLINPDLVNLNLPISVPITPTPPPTTTGGNASSLAGTLKATSGVSISSAGACKMNNGGAIISVSPELSLNQSEAGEAVTACQNGCPGTGLCTREATLNQNMLSTLIDLANAHSFTITSFTGGSHASNSKHYSGSAVDIVPATSDKSVWPSIQRFLRTRATLVICDIPNPAGGSMEVNCDSAQANHIHAQW